MTTPVTDEEEANDHTAKVCEVCHAITRCGQCHEHLNGCIAYNKPLGLNWHGKREDKHTLLGIEHSESEKDAIDGARSAYCGPQIQVTRIGCCHLIDLREAEVWQLVGCKHIELGKLRQLLKESGSDAAGYVIEEKLAWSPSALHDATEHPQGEHIEEYVAPSSMCEHVGEELVKVKVWGKHEVQAKEVVKVDAKPAESVGGKEDNDIYYE